MLLIDSVYQAIRLALKSLYNYEGEEEIVINGRFQETKIWNRIYCKPNQKSKQMTYIIQFRRLSSFPMLSQTVLMGNIINPHSIANELRMGSSKAKTNSYNVHVRWNLQKRLIKSRLAFLILTSDFKKNRWRRFAEVTGLMTVIESSPKRLHVIQLDRPHSAQLVELLLLVIVILLCMTRITPIQRI